MASAGICVSCLPVRITATFTIKAYRVNATKSLVPVVEGIPRANSRKIAATAKVTNAIHWIGTPATAYAARLPPNSAAP